MVHLLLELSVEHVLDLANSCLVELCHGLLLGLLVDLFEFAFEHRAPFAEVIVKELFENLICVHHGFLALILADVAPTGFNRWHGARVNRINVRFGQVVEHFTVQRLVIQLLGLDSVHDLAA